MPHFESPTMAPTVVPKFSTNAPSLEDVSSLSQTIYSSDKSQASLDASYALVSLLSNSVGIQGLTAFGLVGEVKKCATDKKSIGKREGAMFLIGAVFEKFPTQQPISEAVLLFELPDLLYLSLDALADKQSSVRQAAQYALDELYQHLGPESKATALLPLIEQYQQKRTGKWQGSVGAFRMVERMAEDAKIGTGSQDEEALKDILREAMGRRLEGLIPVVEAGMHDLKNEVSDEPKKCVTQFGMLMCSRLEKLR